MTGSALVYSSSLIAAFLGGVLALFAPCCVVSLMPTFAGTALRRGVFRLPQTSLMFSAGIAVVLLPVVLGIGELGAQLTAFHRAVYFGVAAILLVIGVAALLGRGLSLPMPSLRFRSRTLGGAGETFLLGVVSGVVSSCCAPVLVGVIALSALAASPLGALGLGLSYVFGMVFPLFIATLVWERFNIGERVATARWIRMRIAGRSVFWTDVASGAIFLAMGLLALVIAISGKSTLTPDVLVTWSRWSTGLAGTVAVLLGRLPLVVQAALLGALAFGLAAGLLLARRHRMTIDRTPDHVPDRESYRLDVRADAGHQ